MSLPKLPLNSLNWSQMNHGHGSPSLTPRDESLGEEFLKPKKYASSTFVMGINRTVFPVCQRQSRAWRFDTPANDSRELCVWWRRTNC